LLHKYSLFQIPAILVVAIVGGIIIFGIYMVNKNQSAPVVGNFSVKGNVENVSLSI
jgi:uncharacterized protein (DUF983 family)